MIRPRFLATVLALLTAAASAFGGTYALTFDGAFDFSGTDRFGNSSAVPFHFELTIDPALNTNTAFIPASESTAAFYGFSKSSLVSTSLTFDTFTWTASDIQVLIPTVGVIADFFLNTDLVSGASTNIWLFAENDAGYLKLGGAYIDGTGLHFYSRVSMYFEDFGSDVLSNGPVTFTATAIPEPSMVALAAGLTGLGAACYLRRRRA